MANLRLTKKEQEMIRKKSIEINKRLIEKKQEPMKDSEILHKILESTIEKAYVTENGSIKVDW